MLVCMKINRVMIILYLNGINGLIVRDLFNQMLLFWWLETKLRLRELLISLSKSKHIHESNEMAELKQKLQQQLVVSLSRGKKVLTEFKNVKYKIRQRQIKKLQAIRVRSRANKLDRKNQVDAAFFER